MCCSSLTSRQSSFTARWRLAVGHEGLGGGGGGTAARYGRVLVDVVAVLEPLIDDGDRVKQLALPSPVGGTDDGDRAPLTLSPVDVGAAVLMPFTFNRRGVAPPGTVR